VLEPNNLPPAVAREEDAMPQWGLHREYTPTRHDPIALEISQPPTFRPKPKTRLRTWCLLKLQD